jgi:hypothetical protein
MAGYGTQGQSLSHAALNPVKRGKDLLPTRTFHRDNLKVQYGELVGCSPGVVDARASRQGNPDGEKYGEYGACSNGDSLQKIEENCDHIHFSIVRLKHPKREVTTRHVLPCSDTVAGLEASLSHGAQLQC